MIQNLIVTQVVENTAGSPGLLAEHGVAFHIDADGRQLLFDTGQGFSLIHNAKRLGLDLTQVDSIILSHGHYDHTGGLVEALSLTGRVKLYLHPQALATKCNRHGKDISAPIAVESQLVPLVDQLVYTRMPVELFPGAFVTGEIPRTNLIEDTGGPFYQDEACSEPDELLDDQALFFDTSEGLVVLLGCGHSGVINTMQYIQQLSDKHEIHAVIGGMHLMHATKERLSFTGDGLADMRVHHLAPNHCTGLDAVCYFKQRFPGIYSESQVGTRHSFGGT
jgi:7,8-dihydropterin-6-yl-methyl-4-(beta-D-ribofuranosyl)aminobenzene 5'-phosphate synthase